MKNQTVSRPTKVAAEVQRTLAQILLQEVKDPRLEKLSITQCKISRDLSIARINFALMGHNEADPEVAQAQQALEKAEGFFRSEIGKRLNLRIVPQLRFHYDNIPEHAQHIENLINQALNK